MTSEKTQEKEIFWQCLADPSSKLPLLRRRKGLFHPLLLSSPLPSSTRETLPSLLIYCLLVCDAGQQFLSFSLPEAPTPVQVLLFTFPGSSSWKAGDREQCFFFSCPYYSNMNISPTNHRSFKSPQTLPGFLQKGRKDIWQLLNMNGKAKYFSTSVKRINQTHAAPKHPLWILVIHLCSECCCWVNWFLNVQREWAAAPSHNFLVKSQTKMLLGSQLLYLWIDVTYINNYLL